jgi:hypothetical protein
MGERCDDWYNVALLILLTLYQGLSRLRSSNAISARNSSFGLCSRGARFEKATGYTTDGQALGHLPRKDAKHAGFFKLYTL